MLSDNAEELASEDFEHASDDLILEQMASSRLRGAKVEVSLPAEERILLLRGYMHDVKSMALQDARDLLQKDPSPFWQQVNDVFPLFPTTEEYELHLDLLCHAFSIDAILDKRAIFQILREIQATFIDLPIASFIKALKIVLSSPVTNGEVIDTAKIIESLSARGYDLPSRELCSALEAAVIAVSTQEGVRSDSFLRIRRLVNRLSDKPTLEHELNLMQQCADTGKWDYLWIIWRNFAAVLRPRPKEVYLAMLRITAQRHQRAEAMKCLRDCVPEMALEEPPVPLDQDIAEAIKSCLVIAEPGIETFVNRRDAFGEWASLWRRCEQTIN